MQRLCYQREILDVSPIVSRQCDKRSGLGEILGSGPFGHSLDLFGIRSDPFCGDDAPQELDLIRKQGTLAGFQFEIRRSQSIKHSL